MWAEDGPLIIMTHGWPELSIGVGAISLLSRWSRLPRFDMRGYGSSLYTEHEAHVQREIVQDMVEPMKMVASKRYGLADCILLKRCLHHPERVAAVASLRALRFFRSSERSGIRDQSRVVSNGRIPCRPMTTSFSITRISMAAQKEMEQDPERIVKLLFRK